MFQRSVNLELFSRAYSQKRAGEHRIGQGVTVFVEQMRDC